MSDRLEFVIGAKDKFSGTFGKLKKGLHPGLTGAAKKAAVAVAGIGVATFAMTKTTATAYDQVRKFSDQLGLSTEFLSSMRVAADFSGIAVGTMDKAVQKLQVGVGEASKGLGTAKDTFADLGVEIYDMNGELKNAEQLMPELADAFKDMTNATERAEAASKLFGQRGMAMLQMFGDGRDGLAELTAEAERFGLVISDDAANKAADFNDSLTRLIGSVTGVKNEFAEQLMPVMTQAFNKLAGIVADNRGKIVESIEDIAVATYGVVKKMAIGSAGIADAMAPMASAVWETVKSMWNSFRKLPSWVQAVGVIGAVMGGKKGAIVIGSLAHLANVAKTSVEGFSAALAGHIKMTDLATMNHEELVAVLKDLHDRAVLPKKINMPMPEIDVASTGYKEKVEAVFAEIESIMTMPVIADMPNPVDVIIGTPDQMAEGLDRLTEFESERFFIVAEQQRVLNEALTQAAQERADKELAIEQAKTNGQMTIMNSLASVGANLGETMFKVSKAASIAQAMVSTYTAAANAYRDVPYPWNIPASAAITVAGLARVAQIKAVEYTAAHGGMTNVPSEQTMLVDKNERILSPNQNADLTEFMKNGGGRGTVIENVAITFNGEDLLSMSSSEAEDFAEQIMIPALKQAAENGVTI